MDSINWDKVAVIARARVAPTVQSQSGLVLDGGM